MKSITLITILLSLITIKAESQSNANSSAVTTLTLNDVINISVIAGPGTPNFTFSTIYDYTYGITHYNAVQITVSSTRNYNVTVKAATSNFTNGGYETMPVSILGVRPYGGYSFITISTTDQTLFSNQSYTSGTTLYVDYNANPGISGYKAGTYSGNIIYTATQL